MPLPNSIEMDWLHWFERWEAMQCAYLPQRQRRFDLMFQLADFTNDAELRVLDLGCGPGSVSFCALRHYPNARIVAVDADPVLLAMGKGLSADFPPSLTGECVQSVDFFQADLRDGTWWAEYNEAFDMVVSATALHWLTAEHLTETYRRIYRALKPGGWFFNADHIASDNPVTQARYQQLLHEWQQVNFDAGAEDWDSFWRGFEAALKQAGLSDLLDTVDAWEGTDDGQPKAFHFVALRECSFENVAIHWQDLGEALIGVRK